MIATEYSFGRVYPFFLVLEKRIAPFGILYFLADLLLFFQTVTKKYRGQSTLFAIERNFFSQLFWGKFSGQKKNHNSTTKWSFNGFVFFCEFWKKKNIFFLFPKKLNTIEIWLILPVVICLFQGLSHACLRITAMQESAHGSLHQTQSAAKMLRKRIIGYLVRNAKLIHELMGSSRSTRRRFRPKAWWPTLRMNESTNQCTSRCSNTE